MEGGVDGPVVKPRPVTGSEPLAQNNSASDELMTLARAARQKIQLVPTSNDPESRKDSAVSTSSPEDYRKGSLEGPSSKFSNLSMTSPPSRDYDSQRSRFSSIDENVRLGNEGAASAATGSRRPSRLEPPEALPPGDSINDSPRLRKHAISPSEISPRQTLPAMQIQDPNSPPNQLGSPNTTRQQLPSFQHLSDIADVASQEHEARNNSISHQHQHRPSTSISSASTQSAIAQSPNQLSRSFQTGPQRRSSPFGPPLSSHTSPPASAHSISEASPLDSSFRFGREMTSLSSPSASSIGMNTSSFYYGRQQSQVTEAGSGSYSSSVPSTSTGESHPSTGDGLSPAGHAPAEHRMSLDGTARSNIILPPPVPHQAPRECPPPAGGYRCDHPGCSALPFQTQYLLKYVLHFCAFLEERFIVF